MALHTDPTATDITNQEVLIGRAVRVMATGAGEGIAGPARIAFTCEWMVLDGMPLRHADHGGVTTHAKVIDFPKELKAIVGGMGAVTGPAALGMHDAMYDETTLAGFKILLHALVADHAELAVTIGP